MKTLSVPSPYPAATTVESNKLIPARLWYFTKRHFWIPLLTGTIAAVFLAIQLHRSPVQYSSTGALWVAGKIQISENNLYREDLQNYFGTQIQLLQSARIVGAAHSRTLESVPGSQEKPVELRIVQQRNASVFVVQATCSDPDYVQNFLNSLMQEYIRHKQATRQNTSDETINAIKTQLYSQDTELKTAQQQLNDFERTNNVAVLREQGISAASFLAKLNAQLADLHLEDEYLSSLITNLAAANFPTSVRVGTSNELAVTANAVGAASDLMSAKTQLELLKAQKLELEKTYKAKHPKMVKKLEEVVQQEKLVSLLEAQIREKIIANRDTLKSRMKSIVEARKEWEAKVATYNQQTADHAKLRSSVETAQTTYNRLASLAQNLGFNQSLDKENIEVLERASIPFRVKQSVVKRVVIPSLIAMLAGFGIIFLIARFDDRITSVVELESHFEEPIVGYIPEVKKLESAGSTTALLKPDDHRHMFVESFRNLRSALIYLQPDNAAFKTLVISSAVPVEGKSLVTLNLAQTLAWAGNKVLLVDGDLRRGHLHEYLELPGSPGFSELLKNGKDGGVVQTTQAENLYFLPRGAAVKHPGELLLHENTAKTIQKLAREFNYVLIDSAPVLATDDTTSLAPRVDGVLFVVRCSSTGVKLARKALALLYQRKAKVLGVVFNRARSSERAYYMYKYDEYYSTPVAP